jgi:hypothetical protein
VLGTLYLVTRPPFLAFLAVPLVTGYANGVLESVLTVYLAGLPDATTQLNRLHAFFGVGALLGPVMAGSSASPPGRWSIWRWPRPTCHWSSASW